MSKVGTSFKDLGPILIVLALVSVGYMAIRDRLNWNRDRINELVGKHATLESRVAELERNLSAKVSALPPVPRTRPLSTAKIGDISFFGLTQDDPKVQGEIVEWIKALKPGYEALKAKYKPEKGRAIVLRIIFGANRKVERSDYIKAPSKVKLRAELKKHIRNIKFPESNTKTEGLSMQINFEP